MSKRKPRMPRPMRMAGGVVEVDEVGSVRLPTWTNVVGARRLAAWLVKYAEWREGQDRG